MKKTNKQKKEIRKRALEILPTYANDGDYYTNIFGVVKMKNPMKYYFKALRYIYKCGL